MDEVDRQAIIRVKHQLASLFKPKPWIYWPDLLLSSAVGWSGFVLSFRVESLWLAALCLLVGMFGLFRAVVFTHEMEHMPSEALPGFRAAWHLLVGMPLCVPHFMYRHVHRIHHSTRFYGTAEDPEYMPFVANSSFKQPVTFLALGVVAPLALSVRFLLLAPLSLFSKQLRANVVGKASGFVLKLDYTRAVPTGSEMKIWLVEEFSTSLFAWSMVLLVWLGVLPKLVLLHWYLLLGGLLFTLTVRGLAATHRYASNGEVLAFEDHVYDSVNLQELSLLNLLVVPVGLNFHATHHIFPGLPYYALRTAHRLLMQESQAEGQPLRCYVSGQWSNLPTAIGNMIKLTREDKSTSVRPAAKPATEEAFPDF